MDTGAGQGMAAMPARWFAGLPLALALAGLGTAVAAVRLPPAGAPPDYQLGGAYPPAAEVAIVARDREDPPAPGIYSICYINGFQTQAHELALWPAELILHDGGGQPVGDPDWPGEYLLDTSTAAKRAAILAIVAPWIEGCATAGFDAVEFDNLDSYTRSGGLLVLADNLAMASAYVAAAHQNDLAAGQKNLAEESATMRAQAGFDFAVSEECVAWDECGQYTGVYGPFVIDIEYPDDLGMPFQQACAAYPEPASMVLRDLGLSPAGTAGHVFELCADRPPWDRIFGDGFGPGELAH